MVVREIKDANLSSPLVTVCPFCSLHCDELLARRHSLPSLCRAASDELDRVLRCVDKPRLGEAESGWDSVREDSLRRIKDAQRVKIWTRLSTISTARVLSNLPDRFQVEIDATPTEQAYRSSVARSGVITATLGDVATHADTIVTLGNVTEETPRLMEALGVAGDEKISTGFSTTDSTTRVFGFPSADTGWIADFAVAARAAVQPNEEDLRSLFRMIQESRYLAVLCSPTAFDADVASPPVELLMKTVTWLNRADADSSRRAVVLMMDPSATVRNVFGWQHNSNMAYASGNSDQRIVTIRIGSPASHQLPVDIQIGGTDLGSDHCHAFLPTAAAGVHHADTVVRGDGTVTLPLAKIKDSDLPNIGEVLALLADA